MSQPLAVELDDSALGFLYVSVGDIPLWLLIVKVLAIFIFLVLMTLLTIVFERKVVAWMQVRPGPNRVGPWGMLQSLADGLKLAFKEDIMPTLADKPVYFIAPIVSCVPAFMAFAVIPIGPKVSIFGHQTALQLTDFPVSVLYVLACSSLGVYGIVLAGWASGSTYPLLGGLRSAAQMISYEVSMGLSIVAVFVASGTLSTGDIVAAQSSSLWYCITLAPSFVIYAISAVGEVNRAPFDLPEAESELVGGFHTEYSSLKFALFFLAEYINMVTVSALATTLFLGGWRSPIPDSWWHGANEGWWPVLWFTGKVAASLFVFIWLRGTLPRLRYDQFMQFGWKRLVPISLVWTMVVATVLTVSREKHPTVAQWGLYGGIAFLIIAVIFFFVPERKPEVVDASQPLPGGGFPLPPLDLVVPPSPRLRVAVTAGAPETPELPETDELGEE